MSSTQSLLNAAKVLLNNGNSWTKYANAVDSNGRAVPIMHPDAVKWDVYGALLKAHFDSGQTSYESFHRAYRILMSRIPREYRNRDIESYNDIRAYAMVFALFDNDDGEMVGPAIASVLADNSSRVLLFNDLAIEVHT